VALHVDRLGARARQALAAAFVESGGRAACEVYLVGVFRGTGLKNFRSSFKLAKLPERLPVGSQVLQALQPRGNPAPVATEAVGDGLLLVSCQVFTSVDVVCGGARVGKSSFIIQALSAAGVVGTVKISVHEGFAGRTAIKQYLDISASAAKDSAVGLHVSVFDVEGVDMPGLAQFLHILLSTGLLCDKSTGEATFLRADLRHLLYIELPALAKLEPEMSRGPRDAWPKTDAVSAAQQHPFLPSLGPLLLLGGGSFKTVSAVVWPLRIDADAARAAAYLMFTATSPLDAATSFKYFSEQGLVPPELPAEATRSERRAAATQFWAIKAADPAWMVQARQVINDSIDKVVPPVGQSVGTRAAVVRALASSLHILHDLETSIKAVPDKRVVPGMMLWAIPYQTFPRQVQFDAVERMSRAAYMPNFYRLFVQLQVVEAAQLVARNSSFTVWTTSSVLHDEDSVATTKDTHFLACGTVDAGGGSAATLAANLSEAVVTHVDAINSDDQVRVVCDKIASVFGFGGHKSVRRVLDDAHFVLTANMAAKLLLLHGRRRIREPLIFEGDTGACAVYP
jgi:hypothetical protein